MLCSIGSVGSEAAPEPPTLFTMEFLMLPTDLSFYPTYTDYRPMHIVGMLSYENLHPEDVRIYMNASIDNSWYVSISPYLHTVSMTRTDIVEFDVYLQIPPHTYGPRDSVLTITAEAKNPTRTLTTESVELRVHILKEIDEVIDGFSGHVMVFDELRVFSGSARLYNPMDTTQEFHLGAAGEWEERIHDLDFGDGVLLNALERRRVGFSGIVDEDVGVGVHTVDLVVWIPDGSGGRSVILNLTVEMEVFTTRDTWVDNFFEYWRYTFPLVIGASVACVYLVRRWWRERHRARDDGHARVLVHGPPGP